jgi:hypothetical protein
MEQQPDRRITTDLVDYVLEDFGAEIAPGKTNGSTKFVAVRLDVFMDTDLLFSIVIEKERSTVTQPV